jgi:hypothetical protein
LNYCHLIKINLDVAEVDVLVNGVVVVGDGEEDVVLELIRNRQIESQNFRNLLVDDVGGSDQRFES